MQQRPDKPVQVIIGKITAPRGIRGEVRVQPLTDDPARFRCLEQVTVITPQGKRRDLAVEKARSHRETVLLKLEGIDDRRAADALRGATLQVDWSQAVSLPEGYFFYFQVVGLRVHTEEGQEVGQVVDILSPGPHDVYVVHGHWGEILIPAVREVVREIDVAEGRMVIHPLPGLLEE